MICKRSNPSCDNMCKVMNPQTKIRLLHNLLLDTPLPILI